MGSCCCSCREEGEEEEEEETPTLEERVRLLEPPSEQERASTPDPQSSQDEQARLATILAKAANSIIDVAAAQSMRLGPHECMDRARLYHNRLTRLNRAGGSGVGGGRGGRGGRGGSGSRLGSSRGGSGAFGGGSRSYWGKKGQPSPPLPSLTNQPHRVLAAALVPYADVQQAVRIATDAHRAMEHVRVKPQEELVVKFQVE